MTREEAIKKLQKQKAEYLEEWVDYSGVVEAYDMAIEALRQPPNEDWERYADHLWKEAYERGKEDALKVGDRYD